MNKCLVSKLDATVTNPTPRIFGKATIIVTSNAKAALWMYSVKAQKIFASNPDGIVIKEATIPTFDGGQGSRIDFMLGDISSYEYVTIEIPHAYDIMFLYGHTNPSFEGDSSAVYKIDLREFSFSPYTTLTEINNNYQGFQLINLSRTDFTEDIFTNLEGSIVITDSIPYNYIDNIGWLGGCLKLTGITSSSQTNHNIYGEWMKVIENQCFNGRTSGKLTFGIYGNGFKTTFNGKLCQWKIFNVDFSETGCELTGGTNFKDLGFGNRATFDKYNRKWQFYEN